MMTLGIMFRRYLTKRESAKVGISKNAYISVVLFELFKDETRLEEVISKISGSDQTSTR
jgi:hypothetical protein